MQGPGLFCALTRGPWMALCRERGPLNVGLVKGETTASWHDRQGVSLPNGAR
jgi:hypothetical protein